ncbi:unnamed protein product [Urochloa decumbens]|uniref:Bifunctional inhibitor/plant lipid transfer protein/seed storage helical domain-containing protein n=1 Tax=Urochloa decumbens TaxID=240449 RepID=A0ABC9G0N4_9POAL
MAAPALHVAILAAMLLLPFLSVPAEAQTKKFCLTQFAIASQACAILPPTSPEHRDDEDEDEDEDEDNDEDEDEDNDDSGGGGGGGERRRRRDRDQHDKKSGVVVSKPASSVAGKPSLSSSMITVEAVEEVDADDDAQRNGTAATPAVGNHTSGNGRGGGGGRVSGHRRRRGSRRHRRRHRRGRLRDGEDGGEDGDEDEDEDEDNDEDNDDDEDEDEDEDDDDDDDDDDGHRAYRDCCRWLKEVEPDCVCQALLRLPSFLVKPQHKYTVKVGHSCKFTYRCGGT